LTLNSRSHFKTSQVSGELIDIHLKLAESKIEIYFYRFPESLQLVIGPRELIGMHVFTLKAEFTFISIDSRSHFKTLQMSGELIAIHLKLAESKI